MLFSFPDAHDTCVGEGDHIWFSKLDSQMVNNFASRPIQMGSIAWLYQDLSIMYTTTCANNVIMNERMHTTVFLSRMNEMFDFVCFVYFLLLLMC